MPSRRHSYIPPADVQPRDVTPLEEAVAVTWEEAAPMVAKVPEVLSQEKESLIFEPKLENAYFCGHLMADLDSIAGAIGAAHLYGGKPARASDMNSETRWALEEWKCDPPDRIEDMLRERPDNKVCLVDFQQESQLNSAIPMSSICGIIDHHALQSNTIITETPIFVDIRPWGCMSSILAHSFALQERHLPKNIAGMLLSAILSDTLNLRSPTTTRWDERMVSMLVQYLDVDDVNELAARQFRAKSHELLQMTEYELVTGDMKEFKFVDADNGDVQYRVGFGVIETTDAAASMGRIHGLIPELVTGREEKNLTAFLLAVVDIVNLSSSLILAGPVEASLAKAAYGGTSETPNVHPLPGLVSRKKDFVPPLTKAISAGWKPPAEPTPKRRRRESTIVMDYSRFGLGHLTRVFTDLVLEENQGSN